MTSALGEVWTPRPLGATEREACLEGLAEDWAGLGLERWQMLATWVHPSWNATPGTRQQRNDTWEQCVAAFLLAADLYDGLVTGCDREAEEVYTDARALLSRLLKATGE